MSTAAEAVARLAEDGPKEMPASPALSQWRLPRAMVCKPVFLLPEELPVILMLFLGLLALEDTPRCPKCRRPWRGVPCCGACLPAGARFTRSGTPGQLAVPAPLQGQRRHSQAQQRQRARFGHL